MRKGFKILLYVLAAKGRFAGNTFENSTEVKKRKSYETTVDNRVESEE